MKLQTRKVKEFAEVITGGTPSTAKSEFWEGGSIPWIRSGELKECKIFKSKGFITELGYKESAVKLMPLKSVLIALTGTTTGQTALLEIEATANQSVTGILPSKNHHPEYLFYYLRSIKNRVKSKAYGGAQPHISQDFVKNIEVPLPDLKTQQKIASILEQADAARQKRKQANQLTEQFLQSAFLEMFGDPVRNEKGWEVKEFGEIALIEKEAVQCTEISDNDLYIGLEHIEKDSGKLLGYQKTNEVDLKSTKFKFTREQILYGKLRPYLNKVCFPNISGICSTDILPIKAKAKIANRFFVGYLMKQPFFIDKATSMSNGANLPRISPKTLETFEIILPPLPLQQKFATLVEQVEHLRTKQRESEKELENLFGSLMQRYFE